MLTNVVEKTRVRAYVHHITSHHIALTHFTFVVFLHHMHHTTCVHHAYLLTNTHTYCMYVRTYVHIPTVCMHTLEQHLQRYVLLLHTSTVYTCTTCTHKPTVCMVYVIRTYLLTTLHCNLTHHLSSMSPHCSPCHTPPLPWYMSYVRTYSPPCIVISPTPFHPCPPIVPPVTRPPSHGICHTYVLTHHPAL